MKEKNLENKNISFKYLKYHNLNETSLFLLNNISLFKNTEANKSNVEILYLNGLVNSYLSDINNQNNYNNSIYLVFKKDFTFKKVIRYNFKNIDIIEYLHTRNDIVDYYEDEFNYIFIKKLNRLERIFKSLLVKNQIEDLPDLKPINDIYKFYNGFKQLCQFEMINNIYNKINYKSIDCSDLDIININNDILYRKSQR